MSSLREGILSYIATQLASASGVSGRVYRSRPEPAALSQTPCIFVNFESDQPNYEDVHNMDWSLTARISIVVRGATPDTLADPIAVSVYSILMADRTFGGLVLDVLPGEQRMDIIQGDKPIGVLHGLWRIRHRTPQNTLDS